MIEVSESTRVGMASGERSGRSCRPSRRRRCGPARPRGGRSARPCRRPCRRGGRAELAVAPSAPSDDVRRPPPTFVERPTSRLSKRITWKPRSASSPQNSSSQPSICMPRPMIEQERRVAGIAEALVGELDPAADVGALDPLERGVARVGLRDLIVSASSIVLEQLLQLGQRLLRLAIPGHRVERACRRACPPCRPAARTRSRSRRWSSPSSSESS